METKLSVTFILKGRLPLTKEAADSLEKQQQGLGYHKEVYKGFDKNGKPTNVIYKVRNNRDCSQSINMTKEAYEHMVSATSFPEGFNKSNWAKMSKTKRLEEHLNLICKDLGGVSFTYKVFDD